MFLLVADERGLSELGGHLMIQKLTRPCAVTSIDLNNQSAFKGICKNALVLVDNTRLGSLVSAVITAVEAGYFKQQRPTRTRRFPRRRPPRAYLHWYSLP